MIFHSRASHRVPSKLQDFSYVEVILLGLNYSFTRLTRHDIELNLQYGDSFNVKLPVSVMGRVYKRRLVLFGNILILKRWIYTLMLLRYPNAHTGKGLRLRLLPYHVKPGKERRR